MPSLHYVTLRSLSFNRFLTSEHASSVLDNLYELSLCNVWLFTTFVTPYHEIDQIIFYHS